MTEFLTDHVYWLFWLFAVLCALLFYLHHKKRIRALLLGSLSGVTSLFLLHFFGEAIGYAPSLCGTNLALSALLGVPGTALLMAVHYFGA